MAEGDEIRVGDVTLTAMETPGHTPEHLAWLATRAGADRPDAVFTGGSLMVGSAGRTDLLGRESAEELTRAQFHSLHRLRMLPDVVRVLPTHGAGSFCGSSGEETRRTSTVGDERAENQVFQQTDLAAFVRDRLTGLLEYPSYYRHMAGINRTGPALLRDLPSPTALDAAGSERAVADGARIVDGRGRRPFADAHVPGSLNIELNEQFASYVGWLLPWASPIVLILPDPERDALEEAFTQIRSIGFDDRIDHLAGGVEAWATAGRPLSSYPTGGIADLCGRSVTAEDVSPAILDVRQPGEWAEGTIPGSRTIFVGDLPWRAGEVPPDEETWVICRTGHRAAMAASILDARGVPVRLVASGGVPDWLAECGSEGAETVDTATSPPHAAGSR
jgi:rhodanese-related sulfurtransferase